MANVLISQFITHKKDFNIRMPGLSALYLLKVELEELLIDAKSLLDYVLHWEVVLDLT